MYLTGTVCDWDQVSDIPFVSPYKNLQILTKRTRKCTVFRDNKYTQYVSVHLIPKIFSLGFKKVCTICGLRTWHVQIQCGCDQFYQSYSVRITFEKATDVDLMYWNYTQFFKNNIPIQYLSVYLTQKICQFEA